MKKNKILFLINTLQGGGAEKVLIDIVNMLSKDHFNITVQTILNSGVYKEALGTHVRYTSIVKSKNKFLTKTFSYLVQFVLPPKLVYRLFVRDEYDFEVAFLEGVPAKILSGSYNKKSKKYAWIHTDMYAHFDAHRKVYKKIEQHKKMYSFFDKIICVSKGAKEGFIKQFGINENIEVIYNVYNDKNIIASAKEKQDIIVRDDIFKVISVGRLCKVKGFDRLLRVHKRLITEGLFHRLYIVGEGYQRQELENYIQDNDLQESVTLIGFDKNPYKYMSACDLFVCSSWAEGFSTVVSEAMILGIPVVGTDVAGIEEQIYANDISGIVVENSEEGIYEGLKTMLTQKEKYDMCVNGAKKRAETLKMEILLQPIEKLFDI